MNNKCNHNNIRGFTLVELMIVVLLTGIAVIAIYRGYTAFSHSADVQEQIIEMQQNLRVGMHWLEKDIRRAGMNEENDNTAGFEVADAETLTFNMDLWGGNAAVGEDFDTLDALDGTTDGIIEDITGDGDFPLPNDEGERIRYSRHDEDADGDGELDPGEDTNSNGTLDKYLLREAWTCNGAGACSFGLPQAIITNIDALSLVYLDEDGNTLEPVAPATELSNEQRENIRSVEITMVVRTTNEDYRYTNNESYENTIPVGGSLVTVLPPQGDNFRRRVLSKEIKIRNAGL